MSTAIYFYKKLGKEEKEKILKDLKQYNSLSDMLQYLNEEFWDGTLIHPENLYMDNLIGLYTKGWKFAFNREFWKFCEPAEESIRNFLTGEGITIFDEHGVMSFKDFWNLYVKGSEEGWTTKSYVESHPELMEFAREMMLESCDEESEENGFRTCKF